MPPSGVVLHAHKSASSRDESPASTDANNPSRSSRRPRATLRISRERRHVCGGFGALQLARSLAAGAPCATRNGAGGMTSVRRMFRAIEYAIRVCMSEVTGGVRAADLIRSVRCVFPCVCSCSLSQENAKCPTRGRRGRRPSLRDPPRTRIKLASLAFPGSR